MRREIFRMSESDAVALLARAPVLHLATTTPDGTPVLRALDGAICDGAVIFHGAPAGEKVACVGRPAVVAAEEVVAGARPRPAHRRARPRPSRRAQRARRAPRDEGRAGALREARLPRSCDAG